jgi:CheY-like chemotaxis protein
MTILLVEDNLVIQKIESALIRSLGYEVSIAGTGELAVDLVQRNVFSLILMDMQLPGIDGLETTRRIRNLGIKTPIIAITGNNTTEDKMACKQAGMNAFLTKPIQQMQLESALKHFL